MLDEDGHIRDLPASEWRKFEWDSVVKFMHNYPVYVLPTTEFLDVLDDLTADYEKTIEIGAGTGSIGRLLGIKMTDSHLPFRYALCTASCPATTGQLVASHPT